MMTSQAIGIPGKILKFRAGPPMPARAKLNATTTPPFAAIKDLLSSKPLRRPNRTRPRAEVQE
jgi:hypothetical protein